MNKSKYSDEIINYIKESLKGHVELENELGISRNTIRSIRKRFEIKIKKENKLSDKDIDNLIIDFKNGFEYSNIQIGGNHLLESLSKYNIIPNKTWSYVPVNLNNDVLMFSFLRGFFDGDGSITNHKYKFSDNRNTLPSAYQISIVGNFSCMLFIKEFLQKHNIKSSMIKDKRKYSHDFYHLVVSENSSIYLFLKHIYKNSVVHLNRKQEIANLFINKFEENAQGRIKYKNTIQNFTNCPLYK